MGGDHKAESKPRPLPQKCNKKCGQAGVGVDNVKIPSSEDAVKGGIGLILTKKRIPVLPVAIQTKNFKMRIFKKTKLIIGKPMYIDVPTEMTGKKNDFYNEISTEVFTHICGLLDKNVTPQPKAPKFLLGEGTEIPKLNAAEKSSDGLEDEKVQNTSVGEEKE